MPSLTLLICRALRRKKEEYANARDLAIAQARFLAEIQTHHDDAFQRVVEGSVIGSATSDVPGQEELSEDGALSQAMSDDDPDLAPKELPQSGSASAVAQEPPPASCLSQSTRHQDSLQ